MSIVQAFVLALVQGLTEFLPISSSGHLVLGSWIFGWPDQGVLFDVAVHAGTLAAAALYFRRLWIDLAVGVFRGAGAGEADRAASGGPVRVGPGIGGGGARRLVGMIVVASVPISIAGVLLQDGLEGVFRSPEWVGGFLLVTAAVLTVSELVGKRSRDIGGMTFSSGLAIGLAQAFAVLPGVSRTGATIAGALLGGMTREAAARFSFLLAAPAIIGAGLLLALEAVTDPGVNTPSAGVLLIGISVSFASGLAAIGLFMRLLRSGSLWPFVAYCVLAGGATLSARAAGL